MQCLGDIYAGNVLESNCAQVSPKPNEEVARRSLKEEIHFLHPSLKHKSQDWWCKVPIYIVSLHICTLLNEILEIKEKLEIWGEKLDLETRFSQSKRVKRIYRIKHFC